MKTTTWFMLVCALALTACGSDDKTPTKASAGRSSAAAKGAQDMTAEQVAKEARGKVKCPAKVASRAPKLDAAIDVVGVWPGMKHEEAENVVLCSHELLITGPTRRTFSLQTYGQTVRQGFEAGFAQPKVNVQKSSRDYRREWEQRSTAIASNRSASRMEPGSARWYVGTMGMPGEERVINVARQERYEEGKHPTAASVRAALIKKYGEPTDVGTDRLRTSFTWTYDARGRRIGETSPLYHRCRAPTSFEAAVNFSPDCGYSIGATLIVLPSNSDLVDELVVTSVDQAGGYEAIQSTELALAQLDAQRRAKETEAASRNAAAPTL
jgi:hypothetical protein